MSYDEQFKRFKNYNSGRMFTLEDGHFLATVNLAPVCWAWTVWYEGRLVAGRTSAQLDVFGACDEACSAIDRLKTEAATPAT